MVSQSAGRSDEVASTQATFMSELVNPVTDKLLQEHN